GVHGLQEKRDRAPAPGAAARRTTPLGARSRGPIALPAATTGRTRTPEPGSRRSARPDGREPTPDEYGTGQPGREEDADLMLGGSEGLEPPGYCRFVPVRAVDLRFCQASAGASGSVVWY